MLLQTAHSLRYGREALQTEVDVADDVFRLPASAAFVGQLTASLCPHNRHNLSSSSSHSSPHHHPAVVAAAAAVTCYKVASLSRHHYRSTLEPLIDSDCRFLS